ncbi:hypothetical protein V2J09_008626 [Rumex salicifolius]
MPQKKPLVLKFKETWLKGGSEIKGDNKGMEGANCYVPMWKNEAKLPMFKYYNMLQLSLSNHKLSGPIPPDLGKLDQLEILALHNNNFYGNIPSNLGNCTTLRALYLQGNYISGQVLNELGNLISLQHLRVQACMKCNDLRVIDLMRHKSHFQVELVCATSTFIRDLSSQGLKGSIGDQIDLLTNLRSL